MSTVVKQQIAPASSRYGSTAVAFHWVVATLIVFLGALGLLFEDIPREVRPFWINVHACVGLLYFALIIARLAWRGFHRPPDLLYALMVLIPCAGIVAFVWHGRAFDYGLFTLNLGVASNRDVFHPAEAVHEWLAYALFVVAGLHALAALYHQFVRRDGVLLRMLPGGTG